MSSEEPAYDSEEALRDDLHLRDMEIRGRHVRPLFLFLDDLPMYRTWGRRLNVARSSHRPTLRNVIAFVCGYDLDHREPRRYLLLDPSAGQTSAIAERLRTQLQGEFAVHEVDEAAGEIVFSMLQEEERGEEYGEGLLTYYVANLPSARSIRTLP